jgi:hypothetical protein
MTVEIRGTVPVPGFEPLAVPMPAQQEPPDKHPPTHGMINGRLYVA